MSSAKFHLPVNWIDGMKINKNHFIATDLNIKQQVKNSYLAFITPYNYGLLLQNNSGKNETNIILDMNGQGVVRAKVINCSAVTRGGTRIDIKENFFNDKDLGGNLPQIQVSEESLKLNPHYVALAVAEYQRIPFGIPDEDENPPRMPFIIPQYSLSIHPEEQLDSFRNENVLIIGKVLFNGEKPELDNSYIPPCQFIYSHPKLAEYHAQLLKVLGQMEIDVISILKRIKDKRQSTSIAETVAEVSDAMLLFLDINMIEFRNMAKYYPPVFIFEQMAALARNINNSINKQSTANREELLNYIQDWSNLKQGEFEELLQKAIAYNYDHDDINKSINGLAPFVNAISKICNTLSNLDFIGKKKDRQIFVKEQKDKPGTSFLVD